MSVKEESDGAFDTDESQEVDNGAPIQYTGLEHMKVKLYVDNQPPVEVRTRTPSEKRYFQDTCDCLNFLSQIASSLI